MSFITHNDDGGPAASMGDFLINKLGPFMETEALWVTNQSPASLSLPEAELFTHAGTVGVPAAPYFYARSTGMHMLISTGTGIDTAQEWFDQPGNPGTAPNTLTYSSFEPPISTVIPRSQCLIVNNEYVTGSFTGHFLFTDGDGVSPGTYVHAVIQLGPTVFRHLWIGEMTKFGSFTGGTYLSGHFHYPGSFQDDPYEALHIHPHAITGHTTVSGTSESWITRNNVFRADGLRGAIQWWACAGSDAGGGEFLAVPKAFGTNSNPVDIGSGAIVGGGGTMGTVLFDASANLSGKARPLIPFIFMAQLSFEGLNRYAPVGQIPDCFRINMDGLTATDSISFGGDTYRVYPLVNNIQSTPLFNQYTGFEGIAYKVIP